METGSRSEILGTPGQMDEEPFEEEALEQEWPEKASKDKAVNDDFDDDDDWTEEDSTDESIEQEAVDPKSVEEAAVEEPAAEEPALADSPDVSYGLMDVLRPARPPQTKNARIIRRFDLEAAKYDPKPQLDPQTQLQSQNPAEAPRSVDDAAAQPTRSREELKALRNRSLAAAAGFVSIS
jgi:hypothetical protein